MVQALGGVKVYLPEAIDDNEHDIHLAAGCQTLNGTQSLAYVRLRYRIGNGSDTDRLQRQQAFLSSVIQKVTSKGTLTNPVKLYSFLDAATKAMSTDKGLNDVAKLAGLAQDVRAVGLDQIEFMTIPTEPYPPDHNRLQWTDDGRRRVEGDPQRQAAARLRSPSRRRHRRRPRRASRSSTAPSSINVRVLNATGTRRRRQDRRGRADRAGLPRRRLRHRPRGPHHDDRALVGPARRVGADARRRDRLDDAQQVAGLGQVVELVIGTDYTGAHSVTVKGSASPTPTPTPSFETRKADAAICK